MSRAEKGGILIMHKITEKDIEEAKKLEDFKKEAFKAGLACRLFSDFRVDSGLCETDFAAGKYMEVVIAWMLGYFRTNTGLYMKVSMKWQSDLFDASDFRIVTCDTEGEAIDLNLKFDRDALSDTADDDDRSIVVRTYPIEPGHATSKKTQDGMTAFKSFLSCVLRKSTILRAFKGREDMVAMINSVWETNSKNW